MWNETDMKRFYLILLIIIFTINIVEAKNVSKTFLVKNISSNELTLAIKKQDNDFIEKDSSLYMINNNFTYIKTYSKDNDLNIFLSCDKNDIDFYTKLLKSLNYKTYEINDKDLEKKYSSDLNNFISINNINVKGIKTKNSKPENNSYNPYSGKLKNKIIKTTLYETDGINFVSNKLQMKSKIKKYVDGFEILLINNTGRNIILKKVSTGDFVGLTEIAKKALIPTGVDFIPFYGIVAGAKTDIEKNRFTRPFPIDYMLKPDETLRILGIAYKQVAPIIDFIFEIDGTEIKIQFNTY